MPRTASDVATILYKHLRDSALFTDLQAPTGVLCKDQRPQNSILEDVLINVVELNEEKIQEGKVEVFIYVPNREIRTGTTVDKSQPNTARLAYLSALANPVLKGFYADGGLCKFSADKPFHFPCEPDTKSTNQHYALFKLNVNGMNMF